MPVTLTNNYKEIYSTETVEKIDELLEENYELTAILEFIDNNSEDQFHDLYEEYVSQGENLGYDVVDAFVELHGIDCVAYCQDAYRGSYDSEADFAEEYSNDICDVPAFVVVDWQATWDQYLTYDYDFVNGFVFSGCF